MSEPQAPVHHHLEPFAAHLTLIPGKDGVQAPDQVVAGLITDVARRCEAAGSVLIGHIKCFARTDGDSRAIAFNCNLTSLRIGARCSGGVRPLAPDEELKLDLVVLVYGLSRQMVGEIVHTACCSPQVAIRCVVTTT